MSDVGRIGLAIVGGAVGTFFGNPYLGFSLGATLGGVLFPGELPDQRIEGPRLGDLRVQSSSYGRSIPIAWGTPRLAGTMIWSTAIQETITETSTEVGGKGGPPSQTVTTTSASYSISMAICILEGEISGIRKMWMNGELKYNVDSSADFESYLVSQGLAKGIRVYTGTLTQEPDNLIVDIEGDSPAYLGFSYVVFDQLQLAPFGNRVPNIEFEVITAGANGPTVSYLDTQNQFASLRVNGCIAPDGNLFVWWHTSESPTVGRMALVSPYTGQILREFKPELYTAGDYATYEMPAINARGDIVYRSQTVNSAVQIWVAGSAPVGIGIQDTDSGRIWADENGDFLFGGKFGATLWQFVRVKAGTTDYEVIRSIGNNQTNDCRLGWDGYFYIAYDSGSNGVLEKIRLSDNVIVGSFIQTGRKIYSVCPAGDGSVWFKNGGDGTDMEVWRIPPDFSAPTKIYDSASSFTGLNKVYLERDWDTGDILWAEQAQIKRYSASGDLLRTNTGVTAYTIATDPRWPERIYIFNSSAPSGGVNQFIAYDRKQSVSANTVELADVITDICAMVGLSGSDISVSTLTDDVRAYVIPNQMSAADGLRPLLAAFGVDVVESAGILKFVKRGSAAVATIAEADMGAHLSGSSRAAPQTEGRIQEPLLPAEISITYLDVNSDYQPATQYSRRLVVSSKNEQQMTLPLGLTADEAQRIADRLLYEAWMGRRTHSLPVSRKYARLEPGDAIDLAMSDGTFTAMIVQKDEGQGLVQLRCTGYESSVHTQAGVGASGPAGQSSISAIIATNALLMDTGLLREEDDTYGFYAAASGIGTSTTWPGGKLFKSTDNIDFTDIGISWPNAAVVGFATTRLGDFSGGNVFDNTNTVTIGLISGSLSSTTELNVLNGANAAYLGGELIKFTTATLVSAGTYTLSGLLRGRKGTEWAMRRHKIGEAFALLESGTSRTVETPSADVGTVRWYKGITYGGSIDQNSAQPLTLRANRLKPLSPVFIAGTRDGSNNITITWTRRARKGAGWSDFIDVPLDESTESYEIDLFAGTTKTITAISQAPDGVITSAGHGYSNGDVIHIRGVGGMTAMNDREFTVSNSLTDTFTVGEDTAGYPTYTSGGTIRKLRGGGTKTSSSPTVGYTAAEQTTDYGSAQNPVYAIVYQMSSRVGRGYPGSGVI
jgi:hypothetical protein